MYSTIDIHLVLPSESFEITCLRVKRLRLMAIPSWALLPTAPVALSLSEPAKSTRFWERGREGGREVRGERE